jgi:hypothetical protein
VTLKGYDVFGLHYLAYEFGWNYETDTLVGLFRSSRVMN